MGTRRKKPPKYIEDHKYSEEGYDRFLTYFKEWQKKNIAQISLKFSLENDKDILEQLSNQPSKIDYIRKLVRDDIKKQEKKKLKQKAAEEENKERNTRDTPKGRKGSSGYRSTS